MQQRGVSAAETKAIGVYEKLQAAMAEMTELAGMLKVLKQEQKCGLCAGKAEYHMCEQCVTDVAAAAATGEPVADGIVGLDRIPDGAAGQGYREVLQQARDVLRDYEHDEKKIQRRTGGQRLSLGGSAWCDGAAAVEAGPVVVMTREKN